jgi:hypothetical protein
MNSLPVIPLLSVTSVFSASSVLILGLSLGFHA